MATRKYAHRGLVTRTMATTQADVTYYSHETRQNITERMELVGRLSRAQFFKSVKVNGIIREVENVEVVTRLFGMPPEVFMEHASEITD